MFNFYKKKIKKDKIIKDLNHKIESEIALFNLKGKTTKYERGKLDAYQEIYQYLNKYFKF